MLPDHGHPPVHTVPARGPTRGRLDQRRACQEDGAVARHNHTLVRHGGHIAVCNGADGRTAELEVLSAESLTGLEDRPQVCEAQKRGTGLERGPLGCLCTHAPPAVHEPSTTAIWGMPAADMRACAESGGGCVDLGGRRSGVPQPCPQTPKTAAPPPSLPSPLVSRRCGPSGSCLTPAFSPRILKCPLPSKPCSPHLVEEDAAKVVTAGEHVGLAW